MIDSVTYAMVAGAFHVAIQIALIIRVLIRPHRDPASRIAWVAVIAALPGLGILAYVLFGEVSIGRHRVARMRDIVEELGSKTADTRGRPATSIADVPDRYQHLFRTATSISDFEVAGNNSARLLADSNATIDAMVADIDAATDHVHLLFYIWLPDNNGCKIVEALKRAAARGVRCRAMADDLGSRTMIRSRHWTEMQQAGVQLADGTADREFAGAHRCEAEST